MEHDNNRFRSVTVFLLATNEVNSLRDTVVQILDKCCWDDIERIVIVLKDSACASHAVAIELSERFDKVEAYVQTAKSLHFLMKELADMAQQGSHFLIMSSDGEMDTNSLAQLIEQAKLKPQAIICASKWMKGSTVHGYRTIHEICSRCANSAVSLISGVKGKDICSLFQIYPISVYRNTAFSKPHDLYYEWILLPVKNGVEYLEIPTVYSKRTEGRSNCTWRFLFELGFGYVRHALRIRFQKK